ncbi:MAG: DUF4185 domain-containing protein [Bacteroidales bacterium]|nr:DUF4185 domain-containing protein [Bacteroidales bacterium]
MKGRKLIRMFTMVFVVIGLACTCGGQQNTESVAAVSLTVASTAVSVEGGTAVIGLRFDGFENLDHLEAVRITSAASRGVVKTPRSRLTENFDYHYQVKDSDPATLTLEFTAYDKAGHASNTHAVTIDNSWKARYSELAISGLTCVSRVTGAEDNGHNGLPSVKYTLYNNTNSRFNVGGTDLGIVWQIEPGRFGMFFGDTFGSDFRPNYSAPGPNGGSWRSNVLLFSNDTDLSDGMVISDAYMEGKQAGQVCFSAHNTSGNGDYTSIPTGAVHANGCEYVHYMNIKTWDGWVTNYSSLYKSSDKGKRWDRVGTVSFAGESNFGQVGYFNHNGTVYMMGTKSGRDSYPCMARFDEKDIEDTSAYEYWTGVGWVRGRESAASVLFSDKTGELSLAYLPEFEKWVVLYFNGPRYEISMRWADRPEGPWSSPIQVAAGRNWAQLYGSFIHPLSGDGKLYFIMSMWLPYNTYLMCINVSGVN